MTDVPRRPVFLLGAPRSGTTLLYKALALHPHASFISQWVQRFPALPQIAVFDRIGACAPERRHAAWFPGGNAYAYSSEQRRRFVDRIFPAPAEGESVFSRAGVTKRIIHEAPPLSREIVRLRSALTAIQRWGPGDVLVVKRIANNRRVGVLQAAFPEARFVEVVRDARAVSLSLSKVDWWPAHRLWWLDQTPPEWVAAGGNELELGAAHWQHEVDVLEEGIAHVDPAQHLRVRYEDLIADPRDVLASIAEFGGLASDDVRWQQALDRMTFPDQNERWRRTVDPVDIALMEHVAAEGLVRYGYKLSSEPAAQ